MFVRQVLTKDQLDVLCCSQLVIFVWSCSIPLLFTHELMEAADDNLTGNTIYHTNTMLCGVCVAQTQRRDLRCQSCCLFPNSRRSFINVR